MDGVERPVCFTLGFGPGARRGVALSLLRRTTPSSASSDKQEFESYSGLVTGDFPGFGLERTLTGVAGGTATGREQPLASMHEGDLFMPESGPGGQG